MNVARFFATFMRVSRSKERIFDAMTGGFTGLAASRGRSPMLDKEQQGAEYLVEVQEGVLQ